VVKPRNPEKVARQRLAPLPERLRGIALFDVTDGLTGLAAE
jgi:hypothetical protein